jgi:hypothetical protein
VNGKGKKTRAWVWFETVVFFPPPKILVPLSFVSSFWSICFVSVKSSYAGGCSEEVSDCLGLLTTVVRGLEI